MATEQEEYVILVDFNQKNYYVTYFDKKIELTTRADFAQVVFEAWEWEYFFTKCSEKGMGKSLFKVLPKEEAFITLIHKEYPRKNGYVYDTNSYRDYGLGCYQLVKSLWNDFYIQSVDNTKVCTFDQEWITAFRYSTQKEIKNFKKAQLEIEQIEEEYKKLNNQAIKVYQQKQLISFKFYK